MRTIKPRAIKPITDNQIFDLRQLAETADCVGEPEAFVLLDSTAQQLQDIKQFVDNELIPGDITIEYLILTVQLLSGED